MEYSNESLLKLVKTKFVVMEPELLSLDCENAEIPSCSPEFAYGTLKKRVLMMRRSPVKSVITTQTLKSSYEVSLILAPKVVYSATLLTIDPLLLNESIESYEVCSLLGNDNYMVKSIVVDAQERDPELVEVLGGKEIDARKIEITLYVKSPDSVRFAYSFSGYDKSITVADRDDMERKSEENPQIFIDRESMPIMIRIMCDVKPIRPYYTFRNFIHQKFKKFNPRQYMYFTFFLSSPSIIGSVNVYLSRIVTYGEVGEFRIYKGLDVRRGKYKPRKRVTYEYVNYPKLALDPQRASSMTSNRCAIVEVDTQIDADSWANRAKENKVIISHFVHRCKEWGYEKIDHTYFQQIDYDISTIK